MICASSLSREPGADPLWAFAIVGNQMSAAARPASKRCSNIIASNVDVEPLGRHARVLINYARATECRPKADPAAARSAHLPMMASGPSPQRPSYQSEGGHPHPTHVGRELLQSFEGFLRGTKSNAHHRAFGQPLLERHPVLRRRHRRMLQRKFRYTPRPCSFEYLGWSASFPICFTEWDYCNASGRPAPWTTGIDIPNRAAAIIESAAGSKQFCRQDLISLLQAP